MQDPLQPTKPLSPKAKSTEDDAAFVDMDDQVPSDDDSIGSDFDVLTEGDIYDTPEASENNSPSHLEPSSQVLQSSQDLDDLLPPKDESFGIDSDALTEGDIYDTPEASENNSPSHWQPSSQVLQPSQDLDDRVSPKDESFGIDSDALAEGDDVPDVPDNPPSYSLFIADTKGSDPQAPSPSPSSRKVLQKSRKPEPQLAPHAGQGMMCAVCKVRPVYSNGRRIFPTCGNTCAQRLEASSAPQSTIIQSHMSNPPSSSSSGQGMMCVICNVRPMYNNGQRSFPTCGNTCAQKLEAASSSSGGPRPRLSAFWTGSYHGRGAAPSTNPTSHSAKNTSAYDDPNIGHIGQYLERLNLTTDPPSWAGGSPRTGASSTRTGSYRGRGAAPSIGLTSQSSHGLPTYADPNIQRLTQHLGGHAPHRPQNLSNHHNFPPSRNLSNDPVSPLPRLRNPNIIVVNIPASPRPPRPIVKCVVCQAKPCRDSKYVTCGLKCAEKLCKDGGNPNNCDYCHRRPKLQGHNQCGKTCADNAKLACLLCKSRPKFKRYHLCGKTCKQIAVKSTPLILEAPAGHATYEMVEKKLMNAWKISGNACPPIKKIYKIIEGKKFLQPYDRYKKSVGNEVFRYHGTSRKCTLGSAGNTKLCSNASCSLCCILKTSFKTSLANPSGAFGPGVYSSSAASKAYAFARGTGAILLTKVILGKVYQVNTGNWVKSCPAGFNSVEFDQNGAGNETIVYSDDAIRPVFLIIL